MFINHQISDEFAVWLALNNGVQLFLAQTEIRHAEENKPMAGVAQERVFLHRRLVMGVNECLANVRDVNDAGSVVAGAN